MVCHSNLRAGNDSNDCKFIKKRSNFKKIKKNISKNLKNCKKYINITFYMENNILLKVELEKNTPLYFHKNATCRKNPKTTLKTT